MPMCLAYQWHIRRYQPAAGPRSGLLLFNDFEPVMTNQPDQHRRSNIMRSDPLMSEHIDRPASELGPDGSDGDLKTYFHILFDNRWLILAVTLAITLAAMVYAYSTKPVYQANMLIHVEEASPNATKNILSEVSSLFETKKAAIAEMELLHSRMVIAPAVDSLRLYIEATPKYFPVARFLFAGNSGKGLSEPGLFGYGGYVWGAEKIDVSTFNVPASLQNRQFVVTAGPNNQFRVNQEGARIAHAGTVGTTLDIATADGPIELRVERLDARPGAQFLLQRVSKQGVIERIQAALNIAEQGKQSGVIEVTLQGESPAFVAGVLNQIGREYLRQNLARKTEEAEKSLAFLNTQLPALKLQLERSEAEYNQFRNRNGTVNVDEEAKISLQQAAAAKARRAELLQRKADLLTRLGDEHPSVVALNRQLNAVGGEMNEGADRIKSLPRVEQEEARLRRDIKVNSDMYTALSNTAQQLRMLAVSTVSNVRLVDAATAPENPVKPNRFLIVFVAVLSGLLLGMAFAFLKRALSAGIDDPKKIEKMAGAQLIYATIPHSDEQEQLLKQAGRAPGKMRVLAKVAPEDPAIEALRTLRAALQFSMPLFENNIVTITGPTSRLGKSFICANFATLMAASGKRVLLVDGDLRNGHLHEYFGTGHEHGLYDAINGALPLDRAIRHEVMANLDFIPTGALPPNPSESLVHVHFGALLEAASARYDLVLIDAPPVLAVADALIIGAHAGAVFLLARAGMTTEDEIAESIKRLNQAGIALQGILFNDLKLRRGVHGYQYKYRHGARIEYAA